MPKRLAVCSLSLLAACTVVGPDYKPPASHLPEHFLATGGTKGVQPQWWETLGDQQLNRLIQRALLDSQDIKLAEARLRQARAMQGIQDAAGGPVLSVGGKIVEDQISKNSEMLANIPSKNITTQFTNYQLGFDASWEIDFFGRLQRLSEAATARTAASQLRLQDINLIIAAEVARNYIEYRSWQQRLALAQDNLHNFQELLRLAKLLLKVGEGSALDVQRAEVNQTNYQASLNSLVLGMRQSLTALTVLTGQDLAQLVQQLHREMPLLPVPSAPATGLPADLLKRRPDVCAAESDLVAANADIGAAIGELYPRFSLLGNAGWMSIHAGSLLNSASQAWSIGPTVSVPIFNNGRLKGQVKANEAAFDAALASYRKTVLSAVTDAEVALTRMASNEARRKQLLEANDQQLQLVQLTELQMVKGEATKMAVLDARRNLVNQQDQALQAHAQSLISLVGLFKALGGGF